MFSKMNTTSKTILLFLSGLFTGILIMSVLSYRASKTYLQVIESNYNYEQYKFAKQAMKDHEYFLAVHHYKNLITASSQKPGNSFYEAKDIWTLSFPFTAQILRIIKTDLDPKGIGKMRGDGINHGMLAYALEKYGKYSEANAEWEKASILLEQKDVEKVKQLIENINKT
ncbi:MAG: hypothetical protein HY881_05570 [Deltaproteobacteria bacterium]|nr:hypothetical protein [Deltaproteobacteria bacterium]